MKVCPECGWSAWAVTFASHLGGVDTLTCLNRKCGHVRPFGDGGKS